MKEAAMRGLVGSVVLLAGVALALGALTAPPGAPGSEADRLYFEAPAGDRYAHIDPEGETVLPNGRLLTPAGRQVPTAPHPFGLDLSPAQHPDAFTTDLALSPDGRRLYALDLAHYRLVVIDTERREAVGSVAVGRNPMALSLSADGRRAYVANMGTFRYALLETPQGKDPRGIPFPPFGYPSREAREGTTADGRPVPGLGDPNVEEANSVFVVDLERAAPAVVARLKTGIPVGEAVGGSSPAGLALSPDTLYVSNATNDTVEAWDLASHRRRWSTLLAPAPGLGGLRGVLPFRPRGVPLARGSSRRES